MDFDSQADNAFTQLSPVNETHITSSVISAASVLECFLASIYAVGSSTAISGGGRRKRRVR